MMLAIVTILFALLIACLTHWIYRWKNPKCNGVLPPGSLGLPLIGESLQLIMIPGYSLDVVPFLKTRIQRYGKLFRTSVAGKKVVVCSDPKISHYLLAQHGKLVESWSLGSFSKLFDQDASNMDNIHRYIRSLGLRKFGVDALRERLLPQMEEFFQTTLMKWSKHQDSIDMKYALATMALEFVADKLFGYNPQQSSEKLADLYFGLANGHVSIPLNIPGTTHHRCLQNHKKVLSIVGEVVKKRIASPQEIPRDDFLNQLINDMNKEKFMTEEFIIQLLFSFLFVASDSIATTLTLALKLLEENPKVLQELIEEHDTILKNSENSKRSITWEEYKSMTFTLQVINEVLRLGNISPAMFRKAKQDIEIDGYTIPTGWGIMIATSALHLDPETYKDPLTFYPWRWKDDCKSQAMVKNFMPFGAGMKQCAGAEYARVFLTTFLHVLVTKYQWKTVKGGEVSRTPMLNFGKGLNMKFMQKLS